MKLHSCLCLAVAIVQWQALPCSVVAQEATKARLDVLRVELEAMRETDQAQRLQMTKVGNEHGQNSPEMAALWAKQTASDEHNIKRLVEIIAEIGWPKRTAVGDRAASAAFLILQHSDISYQKKYLSLAREAAAAGEMHPSSLALLEDRILLREGQKQIYGSQVMRNAAGQWEARDLADPENVDKRRASVGLPPLADYLAGFAQRSGGTVAGEKGNQPGPDAPPLTQTLFATTDDARTAYAKLTALTPQGGEAGVQFQFACRDFCARFPDSTLYSAVRLLAVNRAGWLRGADVAKLGDWDPNTAEHDAKLTGEQRATAGMQVALKNADRLSAASAGRGWAQGRFDAALAAARIHRGTMAARDALIPVTLDVTPEMAAPVLRELYPHDTAVAAALKAIEAMGQPCEFQLTTLDGQKLTPRDFRGKVTMLLFSLTTGGSLPSLLPQLKQLTGKLDRQDFSIAWISMDRARSATEEFVKQGGFEGPVHFDGMAWSTPLASRFLIKSVPYYLLLDRQGVLRFRGLAPGSAEATKRIEALIAEAR